MSDSQAGGPAWETILAEIRKQVSRQQYETWFRDVILVTRNTDVVRIGVPSLFLRDWLQNYYFEIIRDAVATATGGEAPLEIVVVERAESPPPAAPVPQNPAPPIQSSEPVWSSFQTDTDQGGLRWNKDYPNFISDVPLNGNYTFDNFVVGPGNKLPHAAALAVADQPAMAYNPLFLHGAVGLGKTHLLQAISHSLLTNRKDLKILFLSCETFTNHFISAVKSGNLRNFRYRYRHVDMLVIDDIHFLAKKEQTQEEFFHTFNTLHNSGKQIILSSDSPPKEIPTLEERLVSRFKWGLVAEIEPPDFETRMLIVKWKAQLRRKDFADDVCEFIADRFTGNIRELEGAILKVISFAEIDKRPVSLPLAKEALRSLITPAKKKITVDRIIQAVTEYYEVKQADLQSRKRNKSIAYPRQICMFLARNLTNHSLEEIGGYFGGRDHTTVIYATEKISKLRAKDRNLKEILDTLIQEIRG